MILTRSAAAVDPVHRRRLRVQPGAPKTRGFPNGHWMVQGSVHFWTNPLYKDTREGARAHATYTKTHTKHSFALSSTWNCFLVCHLGRISNVFATANLEATIKRFLQELVQRMLLGLAYGASRKHHWPRLWMDMSAFCTFHCSIYL